MEYEYQAGHYPLFSCLGQHEKITETTLELFRLQFLAAARLLNIGGRLSEQHLNDRAAVPSACHLAAAILCGAAGYTAQQAPE